MAANKSSLAPVAVIMAGGSGTRFWPLSQKNFPKQFLKLAGSKTLIEQTVDRIKPLCSHQNIFISSGDSQLELLKQFVPEITHIILEPEAKNTAACLMLTVSQLIKNGFSLDTPLMVFPADHTISNQAVFETVMKKALSFAQSQEALVTIGIKPTSAHTGYGYIERSETHTTPSVFKVKRFTEKPKLELATQFIANPHFYWNGGIFVWTLRAISSAFKSYLEPFWSQIQQASTSNQLKEVFSQLPSIPIDTAVLEKAENVFVVPAEDLQWSDLGSWKALFEFHSESPKNNVSLQGSTHSLDSSGCLVYSSSAMKVGLIGVNNLIIVEHEGFLLIAEKDQDQKVKELSQHFKP